MNKLILHISHNDLDGVSCGILTKKFLKNVHVIYCNYDEIDNILEETAGEFDSILITDMCASRYVLEGMMGEAEITVIDHHVTSEWVKDYHGMVHDMNSCAAKLTWQWLKDQGYKVDEYEDYIDCVNDYDLWKLKRKDSLEMNMLFMKYGITRFEERFLNHPYYGFSGDEALILELETERRDYYIMSAIRSSEKMMDNQGREFALVFAELYNSELGNELINELGVQYCVIVNMQKKKVSLRSLPHVDISIIAEENGGGGHKNAAGFKLAHGLCINSFLVEAGIINEG